MSLTKTWCMETIDVELPDGTIDTLTCTSDIDDGVHRFESHQANVYWGQP